MPKISVIMSVFNSDKYVREAVESILNQSFRDFEFLVIDDGSSDKSREILSGYRDARIKLLVNGENIGLTRSLNKALSIAEGQYIARQDADDISLPQRFEKQIGFLEARPEVGILGTWANIVGQNQNFLKQEILPVFDSEIRKLLIKRNPFVHSSVMIKKEVIDQTGFYNEQFKTSQDYELWFRVLRLTKGANLPLILVEKKYLPGMVSLTKEKTQLRNTLFLQKQAIKQGRYPKLCYFYCLRPWLSLKCPVSLKRFLRKHILKSKAIFKQIYEK